MKLEKEKIKRIISFILFISVAVFLFTRVTYLFRNVSYDRNHVSGIGIEDSYDVICVGGSSTFVYWEPFTAWNEYGITSYDLATNSIRQPLIKGYVEEALKYNPKLLVIDMRSFSGGTGTLTDSEGGVRNVTDSLDLSMNRINTITDAINFFDEDGSDLVSYYLDIAKYHSKTSSVLGDKICWDHINNEYESNYLGWEFIQLHAFVENPENYKTDERAELSESDKAVLQELIDYISDSGVNAIFVSGPVPTTLDSMKYMNSLGDFIEENGYEYLNTNNYYDEMNINFQKDFYNTGHVNVFGAEKYTRFLANYIQGNGYVGSHKGEAGYTQWDGYYDKAKEKDTEIKTWIEEQIDIKTAAYENGINMENVDSLVDWLTYASNDNYTVLIVQNGAVDVDCSSKNIILEKWGLDCSATDDIRIYSADTCLYEAATSLDTDYSIAIGTKNLTKAGSLQDTLTVNSGSKLLVKLNDESIDFSTDGMHILVYDNNFNEVLDAIDIYNEDGKVCFEHVL